MFDIFMGNIQKLGKPFYVIHICIFIHNYRYIWDNIGYTIRLFVAYYNNCLHYVYGRDTRLFSVHDKPTFFFFIYV